MTKVGRVHRSKRTSKLVTKQKIYKGDAMPEISRGKRPAEVSDEENYKLDCSPQNVNKYISNRTFRDTKLKHVHRSQRASILSLKLAMKRRISVLQNGGLTVSLGQRREKFLIRQNPFTNDTKFKNNSG